MASGSTPAPGSSPLVAANGVVALAAVPPRGSRRPRGRRRVAVQDLPFGSVGRGGAVGVQDEPPAAAVDADVVVELAQQHALTHGGFAAVFLVLQVVHVAPGGGPPAPGPGAAAVAEEDGAADAGRDGVGVADVQRQRRGVVRGGEQGGAQPAGDAGRAGDEVDGEPGDGVAQRLHRVGGEPLPGAAAGAGRGPGGAGPAASARDTPAPAAGPAVPGAVMVAVVRAGIVAIALTDIRAVQGDAGRGQRQADDL